MAQNTKDLVKTTTQPDRHRPARRRAMIAAAASPVIAGSALSATTGLFAVASAQAQTSGETTYAGAIRAANADGSIPAYTGGLLKPPAGYSPEKGYIDPFASEKPLFTITGANADQYKEFLTVGQLALLKKQPNFKMPIYRTQRTAALPERVVADVVAEAGKISLNGSALSGHSRSTIPFPNPKTGEQAMMNFLMRYAGGGYDREYSWFPVRANGDTYRVGYTDRVVYAENIEPSQVSTGLQFAFTSAYTAPPALAGTVYMVHEFTDPIKNPRAAWVYNAGQRRVRRAPDLAYDNVADGTEGMRVTDQYFGFNGALDRYNWKLFGRREMFVPYNTYKVASKSLKYADIIGKGSANSDLMRYEKHRVWVVEATLKKDSKHIYGKRVFLLDEDSWMILSEDCYDTRGEIWRVGLHGFIQIYDHGVPWYSIQLWHDLTNGNVLISHLDNEVKKPIQFGVKASWSDFQTDALRRRGTR